MPAPEPPPESIILGQFKGLKNTVAPERLGLGELEAAVNVDIDDAGQVRRRRGYTLKSAGNYHSIRDVGGRVLGVKNNSLGIIHPDYSFQSLTTVGPGRLSYTQVGETTYFSSATASGKITGTVVEAWGAEVSAGTWLSPVITPTDTLGEISGKLLGAPPLATEIEYYKGRIYLANDRWIWATELYLYDYVDKTKNFIPTEYENTLLMAVEDGLYVGTTGGLYFLQGTFSAGQKLTKVFDSPVIRGSGAWVPASHIQQQLRDGLSPEGIVPVFLTEGGVCAGLDSGQVFNLTQGRVVFPGAYSAAALYREDSGGSSYVAVADSAGGPSANARIGDYVDAEIVRAATL